MKHGNGQSALAKRCFREYFYSPPLAMWRAEEAELFASVELEGPVLDLGCGDGSFGELAFGDKALWGVDISAGGMRKARKRAAYRFLAHADARSLPFRRGTFGTVASNCVLEHIPDLTVALEEFARVLKPGGILAFSVPSEFFGENLFVASVLKGLGMQRQARVYANAKNRRLVHINLLATTEWERLLCSAGFDPVHLEYYMSESSTRRFSLWHEVFDIGAGRYNVANALKIASAPLRALQADKLLAGVFRRILADNAGNGRGTGSGVFAVARKRGPLA